MIPHRSKWHRHDDTILAVLVILCMLFALVGLGVSITELLR